MRKLSDSHGINELHMGEVRVGDCWLQLRLESYKGWAKVGRRTLSYNRDLGRFKKLVFFCLAKNFKNSIISHQKLEKQII